MENKVQIIAEIGVNHNGNIDLAYEMIDKASNSGVDFVKFQTSIPSLVTSIYAPKAEYQVSTTGSDESMLEMCDRSNLSFDETGILKSYAAKKEVKFLSTPFDSVSIDFLDKLGLDCLKIPSGELNNLPYLRQIGRLRKKIIMSTGMANLEEVRTALKILTDSGTTKEKIIVLHCNTEYPTPMEDVNLNAMLTIRDELGVKVGYSDHTLGIEIPIAAVSLGATVIEKHFTLSRKMEGPDHRASLEPDELVAMVKAIRNIESALGNGVKKPSPSEKKNIVIARKSIVAGKSIKKGETFTEENLLVKRPGTGISPMRWDEVIGTTANKDYEEDYLIEL